MPPFPAFLRCFPRSFNQITRLKQRSQPSLPLVHALAIILYIVSPAIVFLNISYTLLLSTPARIVVYLFDAFYPLYVFFGVACITGALLGLAGKLLSSLLVELCAYDSPKTKPKRKKLEQTQ
ncbi:hypothetical protein BD779DRAFT_1001493 [Infundibulicybe gibba]|nr:hypothetical protein BD779DRAFT_1001493 [Infundibulicybe gibba]